MLIPKQEIIEGLADGLTLRLAANAAGVDVSELKDAMKADPLFAALCRRAIATGAQVQLNKVLNSGDWKAAAWYLERTHKDDFGTHTKLTIDAPSPQEVQRELALLINPQHLMAEGADDEQEDEDSEEADAL